MLSLLSINKVYATCELDIIQRFEEISNHYKVNYRYNTEKKSYTIILKHAPNENYSYLLYDTDNLECEDINKTTRECHNFDVGKYEYEIYGENNKCKQTVKVASVEIKQLNNYSDDPLCNGIEEFTLCQADNYKDIDYETFVKRANIYKKSKQETLDEEEKKQQEEGKITVNKISEYIRENLIQIIIITVFIILIAITCVITIKSSRKSRRLE